MSSPVRLTVISLAVIGGVYAGSTWWLANQVEKNIQASVENIKAAGVFQVEESTYDKTFLTAKHKLVLSPSPGYMEAIRKARKDDDFPELVGEVIKNLVLHNKLVILTDIEHGPLPGFRTLAAAQATSQVSVDGEVSETVKEILKQENIATALTTFSLSGASHVEASSPAFSHQVEGSSADEKIMFDWGGITLTADVSADRKTIDSDMQLPHLNSRFHNNGEEGTFALKELTYQGEQKFVFSDPGLSLESGSMKAASIEFNSEGNHFNLKNIEIKADSPKTGDFIDFNLVYSIESLKITEEAASSEIEFGPTVLDVSLNHLGFKEFEQFALATQKFKQFALATQKNPREKTNDADPTAIFAALKNPVGALLAKSPIFQINKFEFQSPYGKTDFSAKLELNDVIIEDFDNLMALAGKIKLDGKASLPQEGLLAINPELMTLIEPMVEQSFINKSDDGLLSTQFNFSNMTLKLNDKPFNPMMMR